MKRFIQILLIVILILFLYQCVFRHKKEIAPESSPTEVKVLAAPIVSTLYYSGVIQPKKTTVVTMPADGVIQDMAFHYGDEVRVGQLLFSVTSDKFQTDYKAAITQFIKNKTEFLNSQSLMREGDFLHKNQLISEDDYKSKKIAFYNARLAMVQAQDALDTMIKQLDVKSMNIKDLKIENIDTITKLLRAQNGGQKIKIISPEKGVILLPTKGDGVNGELKKIGKGDQAKQGDVLAVVGDVSGLLIKINVSEFNINQLKPGQKVSVTGSAFTDFTLQGEIAAVNRQGESSQGGLPTFSVEILVPTLTPQQLAVIHMGMSAKVAIQIGSDAPKVTIPLNAVMEKNNDTYVLVKQKNGKTKELKVKTGQTTLDSIVIESNLADGETLVIPDKT